MNSKEFARNEAHWRREHDAAWEMPQDGFERAIRSMYAFLEEYADATRKRFRGPVGYDCVLGPAWLDMAKGLLSLLNGETGRFDCGTIDRMVRALAKANGFEEEF